MKEKKRKRLLALTVAAVLGCTLLSGCGKAQTQEEGGTSVAEEEGGQQKEPDVIRIATPDNSYEPASYTKNLPVFQEIQEMANLQIEWETVPNDQYSTYVKTILAAGEDLPDIMCNVSGENLRTLYENGLIMDLKPLIDQYAPNIKKYMEEHPDILGIITQPDGTILSLREIQDGKKNSDAFLIRKDWLDKLGLEVPTTTDELLDVLRAFRDQDPNGNGQADEIPATTAGTYYLDFCWPYMFGAIPGRGYAYEDGKAIFPPMEDNYKEYLKFMKQLYDEKLLDPMFATRNGEEKISLINTNKTGFVQGSGSNITSFNKNEGQNWIPILIPKGPDGTSFSVANPEVGNDSFITKDCENPEAAMRFFDAMFSEEGIMLCNYGVEGISYEMVDGEPVYTDFILNNPDGLSPKEALESIGGRPRTLSIRTTDLDDATATDVLNQWNEDNIAMMVPCPPTKEIVETPEETAAKAELNDTDIWNYKEEMKNRFIMGKDDIDGYWDTYIEQLKEMGIEEILEIEQAKYDRFLAAQQED